MKKFILCIFLISLISCDFFDKSTFSVKIGTAKTHKESGLRIQVNEKDYAKVLGALGDLLTDDRHGDKLYEIAKQYGLDHVILIIGSLPGGSNFEIPTEGVTCFTNNGKNYTVGINEIKESTFDRGLVEFEIKESSPCTKIPVPIENSSQLP